MRRAVFAAAFVFMPCAAFAQGVPVYQSGTVVSGHLLKSAGNGLLRDVGGITGDANARGVSPFSVTDALGLGLCTNSAVTSGQHYSFCLGHDADGNALMQVTANGGATEKSCKLTINGTEYSCAGGSGPSGPASSTNNEPALWNGTAGNALKNARDLVIAHTGGLTTTDTTTPTTFVPNASPGFASLVFKAPTLFQLTQTDTHANEVHSPVAIMTTPTGSGTNGPGHADFALVLGCNKASYKTSLVEGEVDCLWANVTQGAKGDGAAFLSNVDKVDNPAYKDYSGILFEGHMALVAPTTGTAQKALHPVLGWGLTGFQNITAVTAGAGGVCRVTITDTSQQVVANGITVAGIVGAEECNGNWGGTVVDATHIDLTNSVLVGTYTSGGVLGTPQGNLGGPTFGLDMRAWEGQNGIAYLVSRTTAPTTAKWQSAFRVRLSDDSHVAFDMDANTGSFVVQPATQGTAIDLNYSATFLGKPIRWGGNTTAMPRDNPQFPGTTWPGGGALGFNFSAGAGEVDLWNLETTATCTLKVYQKTAAAAQTLMFNLCTAGTDIATPLTVSGGGMTIGSPTGGYKGAGTLNLAGDLYNNNAAPTGTGAYVRTSAPAITSAVLTTPAIGVATGTSLATTGALAAWSGTAIPAGGTTGSGLKVSSVANFGIFFGSGAPTLSAAQGSIYLRSDGSSTSTRVYVNSDGGTTWVAITTAS